MVISEQRSLRYTRRSYSRKLIHSQLFTVANLSNVFCSLTLYNQTAGVISVESDEIIKFNVVYDHYYRQVDNFNTRWPSNRHVGKVGQNFCIAPELLIYLTEIEEFKSATEATDVSSITG